MDKAYDGRLAGVLETLGATGGEGEVTKLPAPAGFKAPLLVAVGLGAQPEKDAGYDGEALRRAAGVAARALAGCKKAAFALPLADAADAGAVGEGVLLGAYSFDAYKERAKDAKGKNGKAPLAEAALLGGKPRDKAYKAAVERAVAVSEELNRARDLVNTRRTTSTRRRSPRSRRPPPRSTASRCRCSTRRPWPRAATAASSAWAPGRRRVRGW